MSRENTTYSRSDTRYDAVDAVIELVARLPDGALDSLAEGEDRQIEREDHAAREQPHDDDHDRLDQRREGRHGIVHLLLVVDRRAREHRGQRAALLARRDELDDHARELPRPPQRV